MKVEGIYLGNRPPMLTFPFDGVGSPATGGMAGLGETAQEVASDIGGTLKDLLTAYNQQQILQLNMDRVKLGLPPINTQDIAPTYNVGLSPEVKQMLMMGGLLLLVVLLAKRG